MSPPTGATVFTVLDILGEYHVSRELTFLLNRAQSAHTASDPLVHES